MARLMLLLRVPVSVRAPAPSELVMPEQCPCVQQEAGLIARNTTGSLGLTTATVAAHALQQSASLNFDSPGQRSVIGMTVGPAHRLLPQLPLFADGSESLRCVHRMSAPGHLYMCKEMCSCSVLRATTRPGLARTTGVTLLVCLGERHLARHELSGEYVG